MDTYLLIEPLREDGTPGRVLRVFSGEFESRDRLRIELLSGYMVEDLPQAGEHLLVDVETAEVVDGLTRDDLATALQVTSTRPQLTRAQHDKIRTYRQMASEAARVSVPEKFPRPGDFRLWLQASLRRTAGADEFRRALGEDGVRELFDKLKEFPHEREKECGEGGVFEGTGLSQPPEPARPTGQSGRTRPEVGEGDAPRGSVQRPRAEPEDTGPPFRLDVESLGDAGNAAKMDDNLTAIELVKSLDGRRATPGEKEILVNYTGWGALSAIFKEGGSKAMQRRGERLRELVGDEEYSAIRASTLNAFYTTLPAIRAMYGALEGLGYDGQGTALEAGCGVGHFIGLSPPGQRTTGVEKDGISASIAKALYDDATIIHSSFEDVDTGRERFDIAIGNPPFGVEKLFDSAHTDLSRHSIHNYFLLKSLRGLRRGGVASVIISRFFLDSLDEKARRRIFEESDLVAAARMPQEAFQRASGTHVVTDVLVFRKRHAHEVPGDDAWIESRPHDDGHGGRLGVSGMMLDHPELVCGRISFDAGKQFRDSGITVIGENKSQVELGAQLSGVLAAQVERHLANGRGGYDPRAPTLTLVHDAGEEAVEVTPHALGASEEQVRSGAYVLDDKKRAYHVYTEVDENMGRMPRAEPVRLRQADLAVLRDYVGLRDAVLSQLEVETDISAPANAAELARKDLRERLDGFLETHGEVLASPRNRRIFGKDLHSPLVMSLYDDAIVDDREARYAPIVLRRVGFAQHDVPECETITDAYQVTMGTLGELDVEVCAAAWGRNAEETADALLKEGLVYRDPGINGELVDAERYLSGDVRSKHKAAKVAAIEDDRYMGNVDALAGRVPEDCTIFEIKPALGSPWLDAGAVAAFADSIGCRVKIFRPPGVGMVKVARWKDRGEADVLEGYGTARVPPAQVLRRLMNSQAPDVTDQIIGPDGTKKPVLNVEQTELVRAGMDRWQSEFEDWLRERGLEKWGRKVEDDYNDLFRAHAHANYDGTHLSLPGMTDDVELRKTQINAVWRMVREKRTLMDHTVGSGKTFTGICGEMEKQRMGICNKSMVVVPNHLVGHWVSETVRAYPQARVLAVDRRQFQKKQRRQFLARIATGDWDMIICPERSFTIIALSRETRMEMVERRITELDESQTELNDIAVKGGAGAPTKSMMDRSVKEVERLKEMERTKLKKLALGKKDEDMISWEMLGVDSLVVDEAHNFKNLPYKTLRRNVRGLGPANGSQKAFDLQCKIEWMTGATGGKGQVTFLTGTPVANTLCEVYHMLNYLAPERLNELGLKNFDQWLSTFAQITEEAESNLTGTGFVYVPRVSKFHNMPELQSLYREMADVVTPGDLERDHLERHGKSFPVPKVMNGAPTNNVGMRGEAVAFGMEEVVQRMARLSGSRSRKGEDNALVCLNDARKRGLDMRIDHPLAPPDPNGRIEMAAHEIVRIHDTWDERRGTQLVFCDMSVPTEFTDSVWEELEEVHERAEEGSSEDVDREAAMEAERAGLSASGGFSVYNALKTRVLELSNGTMKPSQFRFVHEAGRDMDARESLFEQVRGGEVRILMGSTPRMGTGMNVQDRLVGLHHMDAPWRPADMEQRDGRILRQGNMFAMADSSFAVEIHRYTIERTAAVKEYQTLETKARFIEQFRVGDSLEREAEDFSQQSVSFSEMRALSSGNQEIIDEIRLRKEVEKTAREERIAKKRVAEAERAITSFTHEERDRQERLAGLKQAETNLEAHPHPKFDGNKFYDHDLNGIGDKEARQNALKRAEGVLEERTMLETTPRHERSPESFAGERWDTERFRYRGTVEVSTRVAYSYGTNRDYRPHLQVCIATLAEDGKGHTAQLKVADYSLVECVPGIGRRIRQQIDTTLRTIPNLRVATENEIKLAHKSHDRAKEIHATAGFTKGESKALADKSVKLNALRKKLGMSESNRAQNSYSSPVPKIFIEPDGSAWTQAGRRLRLADLEAAERAQRNEKVVLTPLDEPMREAAAEVVAVGIWED